MDEWTNEGDTKNGRLTSDQTMFDQELGVSCTCLETELHKTEEGSVSE